MQSRHYGLISLFISLATFAPAILLCADAPAPWPPAPAQERSCTCEPSPVAHIQGMRSLQAEWHGSTGVITPRKDLQINPNSDSLFLNFFNYFASSPRVTVNN